MGDFMLPCKVEDVQGNVIFYTARLQDLLSNADVVQAIVKDAEIFSPLLRKVNFELKDQNIDHIPKQDDRTTTLIKEWFAASEIAKCYFQDHSNRGREQFVPKKPLQSTWNLLSKLATHPAFISDTGHPFASNRYVFFTKIEIDLMTAKLPISPFDETL